MIQNFLTRIFGSRNERLLKEYRKTVVRINALEPSMTALSDEDLSGQTVALRERLSRGETLDAILPDAFAVCREAARRACRVGGTQPTAAARTPSPGGHRTQVDWKHH